MPKKRPRSPAFQDDPDRLLDLHDLQDLGVMADGTARNQLSAGTFPIPVVQVGPNVKFRLADVRAFIAAQRTGS